MLLWRQDQGGKQETVSHRTSWRSPQMPSSRGDQSRKKIRGEKTALLLPPSKKEGYFLVQHHQVEFAEQIHYTIKKECFYADFCFIQDGVTGTRVSFLPEATKISDQTYETPILKTLEHQATRESDP